VHAVLLSLFLLVTVTGGSQGSSAEEVAVPATVEDPDDGPDLTNADLGSDPDHAKNLPLDRIAEATVPGVVDVAGVVGLPGAPPGPPENLPSPGGDGGGPGVGPGLPGSRGLGLGDGPDGAGLPQRPGSL